METSVPHAPMVGVPLLSMTSEAAPVRRGTAVTPLA